MSKNSVSITVPELGEGIEKVKVVEVLVKEGQSITVNQSLIEVESEKASVEVPSSQAGTVAKITVKTGQTLRIGDEILVISTSNDTTSDTTQKQPTQEQPAQEQPAQEQPVQEQPVQEQPVQKQPVQKQPTQEQPTQEQPTQEQPVDDTAHVGVGRLIPAAPSVRRFARELGIDIRKVVSSASDGRINIQDVKAYNKSMMSGLQNVNSADVSNPKMKTASRVEPTLPDFSRWGKVHSEELDMIRLKTAQHMHLANQVIPQVTQYDESNISDLEKFRREKNKILIQGGVKITVTAIICKILGLALQRMPKFNASIDLGNRRMIYKDYYNIAIAVDTPYGLLVPVVEKVDQKDLKTVAQEISELARLARNRKLSVKQMQGGTITITNLGGLGTTYFTPIVNWPQVAILGLGRAKQQPKYNEEKERFEPQLIMPLSLSYDHRAIDGAEAARFLRWICETMEHPINILMA